MAPFKNSQAPKNQVNTKYAMLYTITTTSQALLVAYFYWLNDTPNRQISLITRIINTYYKGLDIRR